MHLPQARRRVLARVQALLLAAPLAALGVGCIDVPDSVRAQFAEAGPSDRSNYRLGPHGMAKPNEDLAPTVKAADAGAHEDAGAQQYNPLAHVTPADAGASADDAVSTDGGAP